MHGMTTTESRPEAMADVPGVCELPLTRAVVQYRDVHELYHPGGRIQDIGLAVIVEGRYASSARAIDLGSAQVKYLDLTSELVILDWIYDATLSHIRVLDAAGKSRGGTGGGTLRRYCFDLAMRVLKRRGFSPLTRPTLLRIGFRDLCKDLDLHESAVVRIITGYRSVTRVHLGLRRERTRLPERDRAGRYGAGRCAQRGLPGTPGGVGRNPGPGWRSVQSGAIRGSRDVRGGAEEPPDHAVGSGSPGGALRARAVQGGRRTGFGVRRALDAGPTRFRRDASRRCRKGPRSGGDRSWCGRHGGALNTG